MPYLGYITVEEPTVKPLLSSDIIRPLRETYTDENLSVYLFNPEVWKLASIEWIEHKLARVRGIHSLFDTQVYTLWLW